MPRKSNSTPLWSGTGPVRLQRILAAAGFGSRRSVEQLIVEGRVEVDGKVVDQLGATADPDVQEVRVDGESLKPQKPLYYAVNKPTGVVTTHRDPQGRPRVVDLAPPQHRVFPVGRLDQHSEGLILLTNDGWLAQRLAHPRFGVEKIYQVIIAGMAPPDLAKRLERGIHIAEGVVRAKHVKIRSAKERSSELEIVLDEGKNREIRRMLAQLGNKVLRLRRIAFGPLRLGDLPTGACRPLTSDELQKLRDSAHGKGFKQRPIGKPRNESVPKTSTNKADGEFNEDSDGDDVPFPSSDEVTIKIGRGGEQGPNKRVTIIGAERPPAKPRGGRTEPSARRATPSGRPPARGIRSAKGARSDARPAGQGRSATGRTGEGRIGSGKIGGGKIGGGFGKAPARPGGKKKSKFGGAKGGRNSAPPARGAGRGRPVAKKGGRPPAPGKFGRKRRGS